MKIRIKIPVEIVHNREAIRYFIDEILLWGMETEMDIEYYCIWTDPEDESWNKKDRWAVFTVEADYSYMFTLKWGATLHKPQRELI